MGNTLASWSWTKWNRPHSLRDFAGSALCFLFPRVWLNRRLADKRWEEVEINFLDCMVDPQRAAIDVGANSGKYAYGLSTLTPKVFAFEPDPALAAKIGRALPRNVEVHAAAVSNTQGVARLVFPVFHGQRLTALASIEPGVVNEAQTITMEVPTLRLDDFVREPVGFIKIDVEGHELSVLEGTSNLINRERPVVLLEAEERHRPGAVPSVRAFMEALNYRGYFIFRNAIMGIEQLTDDVQSTSAITQPIARSEMVYINNFIFVPKEKSAAFVKGMQDALRFAYAPAERTRKPMKGTRDGA
jgi:FkbM family methyltransferase